MRARITCDSNHPLGSKFSQFFENLDYFSRRTGFDIHNNLTPFLNDTENYDITINFTRAMRFGQVKLLTMLDEHCDRNKIKHKVFNIGSYTSILMLNSPASSYDIEKASVKLAHRKIAFEHMFHNNYLDSYLLTLGHLDEISTDIHEHYTHLTTLSLNEVIKNVEFMLKHPMVKELSLQYKQPGNHRVNDGVGLIIPSIY